MKTRVQTHTTLKMRLTIASLLLLGLGGLAAALIPQLYGRTYRTIALPAITDGPTSLYSHPGYVKNKLNILFIGLGYGDEFESLIRFVVGHGLQAYSPFREEWSKINVWSARGQGDTTSSQSRIEFIKNIRANTAALAPNSVIVVLEKYGAHYQASSWQDVISGETLGNVFVSENWLTQKNPNKSRNDMITSVVMHELGHAIGGLADEYTPNSDWERLNLPSGKQPFQGDNCINPTSANGKNILWSWQGRQGVAEWSYSESGEIPLTRGVYAGCYLGSTDYVRGADNSLMRSDETQAPVDYYKKNLYMPFGTINEDILRLALKKYDGNTDGACGAQNQKACGYSSTASGDVSDGTICYRYTRNFQHLFASQQASGVLCAPCGKHGQRVCPTYHEQDGVMTEVNPIKNGCETGLIDANGACAFVTTNKRVKKRYGVGVGG